MFDEKNKDIINEDILPGDEDTAAEKSEEQPDTDSASPEATDSDAAAGLSELELLKDENDKLKKQINDLTDRHLRALAEYDNYRKRSSKEKDGAYADAYTDVLKQILPVIDNLERAAAFAGNAPEDDNIAKGVVMTLKSFEDALKKLGVEEI